MEDGDELFIMSPSSRSKVLNNVSCTEDIDGFKKPFSDMKAKKSEVSGSVDLSSADMKSSLSPSPTSTGKGYVLKKWRRIKREENKGEGDSVDVGNIDVQDKSILGLNSGKRVQVFSQQNEDSNSSTKAMVRNFDDFLLRMKNLSGKSLTMQRGLLVNGMTETVKKSRGDRVKVEKALSNSGMGPGSQSSNCADSNGTYSSFNQMPNKTLFDYGQEKDCEGQGIDHRARNDHQGDFCKHSEDVHGFYPSSVVKEEKSHNAASIMSMDPLTKSIFSLQSAQEALQKEVLKFKEIGKDFLVDPVQDSYFTDIYQNQQATSSKLLQSAGVSLPVQAEVFETAKKDVETEIDIVFKKKIEADVEYLVISRVIQTLWASVIDQISVFKEQKNLAWRQAKLLNRLADNEKMITQLEKEAEKLQTICVDMASAKETLKLQKRVFKYTSSFLVQILLLAFVFGIFMHQLSPNYIGIVPT